MLLEGFGTHRDYAKALFWYRKAAAQGDADAENGLGVLYTKGLDVRQNYTKAIRYFRKAAASGYPTAMRNIGLLYAYGHGVPRNFSKAMIWLRRAVAAGDAGSGVYISQIRRAETVNWISWLALAGIVALAIRLLWRRIRRDRTVGGDGAESVNLPYAAMAQRWGNIWIVILIPCEFVGVVPTLVGVHLVRLVLILVWLVAVAVLTVWVFKTAKGIGRRFPWLWALLTIVPVVNIFVLLRLSSRAAKWLGGGGVAERVAGRK